MCPGGVIGGPGGVKGGLPCVGDGPGGVMRTGGVRGGPGGVNRGVPLGGATGGGVPRCPGGVKGGRAKAGGGICSWALAEEKAASLTQSV